MIGVDQDGIGDAVSGTTDGLDVFIDGDSDHLEVVISEFFLECLPTWQIEEATSPRRKCDEQPLLAAVVGEVHRQPIDIGQHEVRRLHVVHCSATLFARCANGHQA